MKRLFTAILLLSINLTILGQSENTGTIAGKLTDKEMNGPLPFANVMIKGSEKGGTTDMNGLYSLNGLEPGRYTVVFSFVGYETIEIPNITVEPGEVTKLTTELEFNTASLDEVIITAVSRRDSEIALLLEQKKAIGIKESIGARELAKLGVSDVATATTRISGISSSEASGDIFVRGLGDRYLYTTLNGLPIPSDDVDRKNIDLELFPTGIMESVSISKTYSPVTSADQASGNINITTRELSGPKEFNIRISSGINTNVLKEGVYNDFKISSNMEDAAFGFYTGGETSRGKLINQTWTPGTADLPINLMYSLTAGKRFGEKLAVFFTGAQSSTFEHGKGVFREYRSNFINDTITDAEIFSHTVSSTGLASVKYEINREHSIKVNSLFINKLSDEVYEGGRNGEGYIYEETDPKEGLSQFIRDQNTKQTRLWINQLSGTHNIGEQNTLDWAAGMNMVTANEPNRIRNEVNFNQNAVYLGNTGGFQQRKTSQEIDDLEFNARIADNFEVFNREGQDINLSIGADYRHKKRDFSSKFLGLEETVTHRLSPSSIDHLTEVFTEENIRNDALEINELAEDTYRADLLSAAGYISFNYATPRFNLNAGVRYQRDELDVRFDVGNIPGRKGTATILYDNFYPGINMRYALSDRQNLRIAASKTITLPEFKEVSPFEYVSQTGQVTRGNPDLRASKIHNLDIKWEFFPSNEQLISLTGFYKSIKDPINKVQDRGSAGVFSYFNAGEEATILGLELETRLHLMAMKEGAAVDFNIGLNASRMWHEQDLKEIRNPDGVLERTFRYNGLTETGLQGASDWIFSGSLNLVSGTENPIMASLVASFSSDKIYALGAPERQTRSETFYNAAIIEKSFVTLDAILNQNIGDHWSLKFKGKNLLNPLIERVQNIRPSTTGIETTETVRSYTRGSVLSLGLSYTF